MEPGDTLAERHTLIRAGQFGGVRKERGQAHWMSPPGGLVEAPGSQRTGSFQGAEAIPYDT